MTMVNATTFDNIEISFNSTTMTQSGETYNVIGVYKVDSGEFFIAGEPIPDNILDEIEDQIKAFVKRNQ